ncbi:SDR family oxidoreductase [Tahibacter harae]|uniref:SDR family oxidoreductase n=1 Tax=Tahibacter harae TaxID=2963937 RepID=A0ABT1QML0_9GAMM|nr:SDR family oxidoreductase [Tahibacter harae]MCQ4163265.1 SDR family oxidoreductase [Tahibacter harae]
MHVLVIGASGFLGSALVAALQDAGHQVTAGVRDLAAARRRWAGIALRQVDFSLRRGVADWTGLLRGVDVVVNAAGLFRENRPGDFNAAHVHGPQALYTACVEAGVCRIVHISALGADAQAASGYHRSKRRLDEFLLALPLSVAVAQPSLVFGPGGASARLFLALARLPLLLLPGGGGQRLQPLHRDDALAALLRLVENRYEGRIALAGPRCITLREYVAALRGQLGARPARVIAVAPGVARRLARLTPLRDLADAEALAMLDRGNCADAAPLAALLGRPPRDPCQFLAAADLDWARWQSAWFWLAPLARGSLVLLWIWSGVASLLYPPDISLGWLARTGLRGGLAVAALWSAALLDIAAGAALLWRRWRRAAYGLQLLLMAGYTAVISFALPEFWLHPYAPVAKNVPVAALTLLLLLVEAPRGLSRR